MAHEPGTDESLCRVHPETAPTRKSGQGYGPDPARCLLGGEGEAMSQTSTLWVASVLALGAVMFPIWKELSVISEHLAEIKKLLSEDPK
jgi:hypothetical protein